MNTILSFLGSRGPILLYFLLGAGAAVENLFPPLPADTFVLIGAFLAASGRADAWTVFFVTWLTNTLTALLVYWMGCRYGRPFFQVGLGRYLLNPVQLRRLDSFYQRWGLAAIFFARFLPGLRAMVPVFAGVTNQRFVVVAFPVLVASGLWYGGLVWLGTRAGENLQGAGEWLAGANRFLLALALVVVGALALWWVRTRRGEDQKDGE